MHQSDREHKFDLVRVCAYAHLKTGARVAGELCVYVCLCVCHARQSSLVILNGASRDWALSENPVVFRKPLGVKCHWSCVGLHPRIFSNTQAPWLNRSTLWLYFMSENMARWKTFGGVVPDLLTDSFTVYLKWAATCQMWRNQTK